MTNTETIEPGRVELIDQITQLQCYNHTKRYSSAVWAFLWLSDLSRLQQLKTELQVHLSSVREDLASNDDVKRTNPTVMATTALFSPKDSHGCDRD